MSEPRARLLRCQGPVDVPVDEVVLDDLVQLRPGDQVPADAVVVTAEGLELDESLLSGESVPVV